MGTSTLARTLSAFVVSDLATGKSSLVETIF
jgi:hypothetical protein